MDIFPDILKSKKLRWFLSKDWWLVEDALINWITLSIPEASQKNTADLFVPRVNV